MNNAAVTLATAGRESPRSQAEEPGVAWQVLGGAGRIELSAREGPNLLSTPAAHALARAIDGVLAARPKAVLLSARGPVFCAGGDIHEFARAEDRLDAVVDGILDRLHPALERLVSSGIPLVSAVSGPIGGAGVGLALCADFVLAASSMKLRTGFAALGLSPDTGTSWFLARRVGSVRALQWLLLSEAVDAQTCLHCGAVDEVHPDTELAARAEDLVARLAAGSRTAMAAIKALGAGAGARSLAAHLALEHERLRDCARSPDAREGVAAFLARRTPRFGD